MFTRFCLNKIRNVEAFVHGGPETVEHVYEREDSFQSHHSRRRQSAVDRGEPDPKQSEIWYTFRYDAEKGEVVYTVVE